MEWKKELKELLDFSVLYPWCSQTNQMLEGFVQKNKKTQSILQLLTNKMEVEDTPYQHKVVTIALLEKYGAQTETLIEFTIDKLYGKINQLDMSFFVEQLFEGTFPLPEDIAHDITNRSYLSFRRALMRGMDITSVISKTTPLKTVHYLTLLLCQMDMDEQNRALVAFLIFKADVELPPLLEEKVLHYLESLRSVIQELLDQGREALGNKLSLKEERDLLRKDAPLDETKEEIKQEENSEDEEMTPVDNKEEREPSDPIVKKTSELSMPPRGEIEKEPTVRKQEISSPTEREKPVDSPSQQEKKELTSPEVNHVPAEKNLSNDEIAHVEGISLPAMPPLQSEMGNKTDHEIPDATLLSNKQTDEILSEKMSEEEEESWVVNFNRDRHFLDRIKKKGGGEPKERTKSVVEPTAIPLQQEAPSQRDSQLKKKKERRFPSFNLPMSKKWFSLVALLLIPLYILTRNEINPKISVPTQEAAPPSTQLVELNTPDTELGTLPALDTPTTETSTPPALDTPTTETSTPPALDTPTTETSTPPTLDTPTMEASTPPALDTPTTETSSPPALDFPNTEIDPTSTKTIPVDFPYQIDVRGSNIEWTVSEQDTIDGFFLSLKSFKAQLIGTPLEKLSQQEWDDFYNNIVTKNPKRESYHLIYPLEIINIPY